MTQQKYMPGTFTARARIPGQATAGTPNVWSIFQNSDETKKKVVAVRWIPDAAVAGAATNNFALAVQNRGTDGTGTTAITTTKTYDVGVNGVAQDAEDFTLSATAAALVVASGQEVALVRTVNGTGLAQPAGTIEVDYQHYGI